MASLFFNAAVGVVLALNLYQFLLTKDGFLEGFVSGLTGKYLRDVVNTRDGSHVHRVLRESTDRATTMQQGLQTTREQLERANHEAREYMQHETDIGEAIAQSTREWDKKRKDLMLKDLENIKRILDEQQATQEALRLETEANNRTQQAVDELRRNDCTHASFIGMVWCRVNSLLSTMISCAWWILVLVAIFWLLPERAKRAIARLYRYE